MFGVNGELRGNRGPLNAIYDVRPLPWTRTSRRGPVNASTKKSILFNWEFSFHSKRQLCYNYVLFANGLGRAGGRTVKRVTIS